MKHLLLFILLCFAYKGFAQNESIYKKKAKEAILKWATETFVEFDAPRFENFHLSPSPDYYSMTILKQEYIDYKEKIVFNFEEGKSDRTIEEVKEDTASISKKIEELDQIIASIDPKFDHIEYFFWANIKTNNGLTVYYEHQIKLDGNFHVISFRESSSVGKPDDVSILYK